MIVVGLTGGIGSGKSTVAKFFQKLDIPVYNSDDVAKELMNNSVSVQSKITQLLGKDAITDGQINRSFIAEKVFGNEKLLKHLNGIVHPEVKSHFSKWLKRQNTKYVIKESALIFENNMQNQFDFIIVVLSETKERINRIINRDRRSLEQIKAIIEQQTSDDVRCALADFIIHNQTIEGLKTQVEKINHQILNS